MVLWCVLSSQVMIDYREVSHILLQEAKYLVLKKFETVAFSHLAYQVEPLEDFILLCDIAGISQVLCTVQPNCFHLIVNWSTCT